MTALPTGKAGAKRLHALPSCCLPLGGSGPKSPILTALIDAPALAEGGATREYVTGAANLRASGLSAAIKPSAASEIRIRRRRGEAPFARRGEDVT